MTVSTVAVFFISWLVVLALLVLAELGYMHSSLTKTLYNLCAGVYEQKWRRHPQRYLDKDLTEKIFIMPILEALSGSRSKIVADLGCGTGRISLLLLNDKRFSGHIEAWDFSSSMLRIFKSATAALHPEVASRVTINCGDLSAWTAHERRGRYAVVILAEVSEFLPAFNKLVREISLALEHGGLFLLTKPKDSLALFLVGRSQTSGKLRALLETHGFGSISISPWTARYDAVWARKI